jgi:UDP-glucose 4-epimerase
VVHAFSAHDKVREHFGDLLKNVSLEEGIARMAVWARQAGARQGKAFENIEVFKNLPPSWAALSRKP